MNIAVEVKLFQSELRTHADPERAKNEKRYLKSPMKHYGVKIPVLRQMCKYWLRAHRETPFKEVADLASKLWEGQYHEERMLAIFLLVNRVGELTIVDFPLIEHMVKTVTGWAQLDCIAGWLCGELYEKDPQFMTAVMRRWITDDNFWVRRAALLTNMGPLRHGLGNYDLFEELFVPHLSEKEFFIRKAIGWVLRDIARKNPQVTYDYVTKYGAQMSGLTYREATRRLPLAMQQLLSKQFSK